MIAQFWSYGSDVYNHADGKRLFPLIAIGSAAGAPLGAALAGWLYKSGVDSFWIATGLHFAVPQSPFPPVK